MLLALLLHLSIPGARAEIPPCSELDGRAAATSAASAPTGLLRNTAWLALRAYQVFISPGDGARCGMYPSCSGYALRAARSEGPLLGAWMATARITRAHQHPDDPLCSAGGRIYRYNPPEEDVWWRR